MFVPSLSGQNDHFKVQNGAQRRVFFLTAPRLAQEELHRFRSAHIHLQKHHSMHRQQRLRGAILRDGQLLLLLAQADAMP